MFVVTVTNFFLSSLNIGARVANFIMLIRKTLILDLDFPLSEQQELVVNALRNVNIVAVWAANIPVSIKPLPFNS